MKKIGFYILVLLASGCTSVQLSQTMNAVKGVLDEETPLTSGQVADGLKEALTQGIKKGASMASATDGFFKNANIKIPFPPEVQNVQDKLRQVGMGKMVDDFVLTLNRGAEEAAKEAAPIFVSAITSMTIEDAWGILKGEKNSATVYLEKATSSQLNEAFSPVIERALEKVNATKYYSDLVNAYNKIPFVQKVNPDLQGYATQKAMDGLFYMVAQEEEKIRTEPLARATDLLKRVFAEQDN